MDFDVQHHARTLALRVPAHLRVGPFVCRFNPSWSSPFANYAIPDDHAEPTRDDVSALIAAFRQRERRPRLEYLPACAPDVEKALLAAGFEVEDRPPVMACQPQNLDMPEPLPGLEFREPRSDDDLDELAAIQHRAFGEPGDPEPGMGAAARRVYENGGILMLALYRGEPAGGGSCSAPVDGMTELGGVAVAARFRRRGIGAAISAQLTSAAHRRGYRLVWLEPADEAVQRVYAGIGFRPVGEKLNISLPG
ncbi:GNAT family N-acetyltransferase [Actinospica sp. MGRD01-02]|uniref:GNAT family N-acetyltransferase n=1 Tax=Actinospica acidithermotolerans TaxID=2828514 RepID=A0A941EIU7_9ACTN|nr:GNAT family N-acetyltransferase [Actinospica acidithermotolerans]MBR7831337.1 GNAT family N-acetyltransferase [Actinospica acidithermotolerans]